MAGGKKKKQAHATASFEQLVSKANRDALKPYINETAKFYAENLANQVAARMFQHIGNVQTRIMALERIVTDKLGVTETEIANLVIEIEDEATGHKLVSRAAQPGDLIRLTMAGRNKGDADFGTPVKKQITNLLAQQLTLPKTIEEALVGMKAGETKELEVGEGAVTVRLTLDRVSEAPAPEVPNENKNA